MKVLMIGGDLWKNQIAHNFTYFGVDGVNVFHGSKSGASKQICDNFVPHFIKVHCTTHHINLEVQTLLKLHKSIAWKSTTKITNFFAHSLKRHLEFTSLTKLMCRKGNKIIWNVKAIWISILNSIKKVMAKYIILFVKMALNNSTN
jgi:hypothetical protein